MLLSLFRSKSNEVQREADRKGLSLVTSIRGEGGRRGSILIRDLSSNGFRAMSLVRFRAGSDVVVEIPGAREVEAKVEWTRSDQIGVRFKQPIALTATLAAIGIA